MPFPFSAGEILTAANLNEALGTQNTWTSPIGGGITEGNGSTSAVYFEIGRWVHCRFLFTLGSTSAITGAVTLTVPIAAITHSAFGTAVLDDAGVYYDGALFSVSTSTVQVRAKNASITYVRNDVLSATVPFTWATGDSINVNFTYLAS